MKEAIYMYRNSNAICCIIRDKKFVIKICPTELLKADIP